MHDGLERLCAAVVIIGLFADVQINHGHALRLLKRLKRLGQRFGKRPAQTIDLHNIGRSVLVFKKALVGFLKKRRRACSDALDRIDRMGGAHMPVNLKIVGCIDGHLHVGQSLAQLFRVSLHNDVRAVVKGLWIARRVLEIHQINLMIADSAGRHRGVSVK